MYSSKFALGVQNFEDGINLSFNDLSQQSADIFGGCLKVFRETVFPDVEEEHSCLLMLSHKGSRKSEPRSGLCV